MAIRHPLQKFPTIGLHSDRNVNVREELDLVSMRNDIMVVGRILEPLHVRWEDKCVLRGNRRLMAALEMLADVNLPADLRKALEQVDVFFYEGLTPRETTELVVDHGGQKPLSRIETINTVWRLQRQMYSEREIISLLYHLLARYTDKPRKAYEAMSIPAGPARDKYLTSWLHGTVGGFIMAAAQLGSTVKEQFILSERAIDRKLDDAELKSVKFKANRARITALAAAKNKDLAAEGWNPETGGKEFNTLIAAYTAEDSGPKLPKLEKLSAEDMRSTADLMSSPGMRAAFLKCAGALPEGERTKLDTLDTEYTRRDKVFLALTVCQDKLSDPQVTALVKAIVNGTQSDTEKALAPYLIAPVEVVAPPAEVVAPPAEVVAPPAEVVAPPAEVVAPPAPAKSANRKNGNGKRRGK